MFYESIGASLGRVAETLEADDPRRTVDERGQRERRATVKLLRRIGVIWPSLFQALDKETEILEATLRSTAEALRPHRPVAADEPVLSAEPLARYRELLYELDQLVILLHEHSDEPWAQAALRSVRRGLADAAEVQGRLVDDMLAV